MRRPFHLSVFPTVSRVVFTPRSYVVLVLTSACASAAALAASSCASRAEPAWPARPSIWKCRVARATFDPSMKLPDTACGARAGFKSSDQVIYSNRIYSKSNFKTVISKTEFVCLQRNSVLPKSAWKRARTRCVCFPPSESVLHNTSAARTGPPNKHAREGEQSIRMPGGWHGPRLVFCQRKTPGNLFHSTHHSAARLFNARLCGAPWSRALSNSVVACRVP